MAPWLPRLWLWRSERGNLNCPSCNHFRSKIKRAPPLHANTADSLSIEMRPRPRAEPRCPRTQDVVTLYRKFKLRTRHCKRIMAGYVEVPGFLSPSWRPSLSRLARRASTTSLLPWRTRRPCGWGSGRCGRTVCLTFVRTLVLLVVSQSPAPYLSPGDDSGRRYLGVSLREREL